LAAKNAKVTKQFGSMMAKNIGLFTGFLDPSLCLLRSLRLTNS